MSGEGRWPKLHTFSIGFFLQQGYQYNKFIKRVAVIPRAALNSTVSLYANDRENLGFAGANFTLIGKC